MTLTIRAHFDGKVIVPDEPVDLPAGQIVEAELRFLQLAEDDYDQLSIEERLGRLEKAAGRIRGVTVSNEEMRRENIYDERA